MKKLVIVSSFLWMLLVNSHGDETVTGKLTVDQNANATALEVKGGGTGNALAYFTRDVGADAQIVVHASAAEPQIRLDRLLSTGGVWSFGLKNDDSFRIAKESTIYNGTNTHFVIDSDGEVGIGTTTPGNKLEVNGTIRSKEVVVETTGWPDYVFEDEYDLPTLEEIENHIVEKGHLPGVAPSNEVNSKGQSLGETQRLMMQKIEELTLYVIELKKENDEQQKEIEELRKGRL